MVWLSASCHAVSFLLRAYAFQSLLGLMPATAALQREWMPPSLGAERVWASKVPMLGMKLARVLAAVSVPGVAAACERLGGASACKQGYR